MVKQETQPKRWLSTREAAAYIGRSPSFLEHARTGYSKHKGPAYRRVGRTVQYERADLDRWNAQFAKVHTIAEELAPVPAVPRKGEQGGE